MKAEDLAQDEIGDFYWDYIRLNEKEESLNDLLVSNQEKVIDFFQEIPEGKWKYRYAEDKWTILEVLQHLIDTERIFQYRALAIARKEQTSLPGYDHNSYVNFSEANKRNPSDLIEEFKYVRSSGLYLFRNFNGVMLKNRGNMNGNNATPGAIGFVICGHALHHRNIIKERYL
ncbi:DinB family protein [Gramella sp. AN32]|uniref:DinB family protein n=1 Tax=Christiangramia antarctica TaxID=2058158 RepID=A0ABW5X9D4_9FLAO|nr:DinB family protein [Gramella sp. AN32]MCM4157402.1 damage-inducible protein DinB [Gramella sp. AN32]